VRIVRVTVCDQGAMSGDIGGDHGSAHADGGTTEFAEIHARTLTQNGLTAKHPFGCKMPLTLLT
jgi:hypothetical protein